ncbi:MAG: hypothetical protein JNM72_23660 [Deltaproteobacteria bacterium]|nr:hypothetical protein [Deltaproteobacteria bacterium]
MSRSNYNLLNYQSSSTGYQGTNGGQGKGGGYAPTTRDGGHGLKPSGTSSGSTGYLSTDYNSTNDNKGGGSTDYLSTDYNSKNNTNEIIESSSSESSSSESDTSLHQIESNLLKYGQVSGGSSGQDYLPSQTGGGYGGYKLSDYTSSGYGSKGGYGPNTGSGGKKKDKTGVQVQPEQVQEQPQQVDPQVIPSRKQRLEQQRERERSQWHTDLKQRTTMPTIPLQPQYRGEQTNQQTGPLGMLINGKSITGTHYAHSGGEYNTDIVDGKLNRGGKTVDSTHNKRVYMKDHAGRSNYAMDGAGGFYSSSVKDECDKYAGETTGKRHNHSSLVGGGDVTAAGTMVVKDGKVDLLADDSGHYQPNMTQTFEAVKHLRDREVMSGKSKVELVGKKGGQENFTSSVDEFMRYEDVVHQSRQKTVETGKQSHLNRPEQLLRKELGARRKLDTELKSKQFSRKNSSENTSQRRMRSVDQLEQGLQNKRAGQLKDMWADSNPQQQTLTEQDLNAPTTELPELQLDPSELQEQPLEMLNLEPEQLEEVEQEVESEDSDQGGVSDYLQANNQNQYAVENYGGNDYADKYLQHN